MFAFFSHEFSQTMRSMKQMTLIRVTEADKMNFLVSGRILKYYAIPSSQKQMHTSDRGNRSLTTGNVPTVMVRRIS